MLTSLRDILTRAARAMGVEPALHLSRIQSWWVEVVGPELGARSEPWALRGQGLFVTAAHPVVAQELRLREAGVLRELRRRCPEVEVRRLMVNVSLRAPGNRQTPAGRRKPLGIPEGRRDEKG